MENQYVLQTAWSHMGLGACPSTHWAGGDSLALLQVANLSQSNTQTLSHTQHIHTYRQFRISSSPNIHL